MKNKRAFTLAEALMTLIVIGIIATLTIPSVISNHKALQYKTAYKKLVESVRIPVFWSGDIKTKDDVEYARSIGCAGVMIGRNAIGNPEIFSILKGINPPYSKKDAVKTHLELLKSYYKTERTLVSYFKKHLMWYVKSTNNATLLKQQILQYTTLEQIESLIAQM